MTCLNRSFSDETVKYLSRASCRAARPKTLYFSKVRCGILGFKVPLSTLQVILGTIFPAIHLTATETWFKPNQTCNQITTQKPKQRAHKKLYTYSTEKQLQPGLSTYYAIQPENKSGLFYSSWGSQGALQ